MLMDTTAGLYEFYLGGLRCCYPDHANCGFRGSSALPFPALPSDSSSGLANPVISFIRNDCYGPKTPDTPGFVKWSLRAPTFDFRCFP